MSFFSKILQVFRLKMPRGSLIGQFIRYLFTGGIAFVVDFSLFALCLYVFEWHYLVANIVGLMAGLVINYYISIVWVFSQCNRILQKKKSAEFGIFALVGFLGVALNQLCMFIMIGQLEFHEMFSKMASAAIVLMWNFFARKAILFRSKKRI